MKPQSKSRNSRRDPAPLPAGSRVLSAFHGSRATNPESLRTNYHSLFAYFLIGTSAIRNHRESLKTKGGAYF